MKVPFLPMWNLQPNRPCFYDSDSATMLELAAKMQAAFNSMVEDYNNFAKSINEQITTFISSTSANQETFQSGIRQEIQNFIADVNLRLAEMQSTLDDTIANINTIAVTTINKAIADGKLNVAVVHNPGTEDLNIVVTGGV